MAPIHAQKRQISPMIFSESMYMIQGKSFRFGTGRNYLKVIHEVDNEETLLMTGRQVEKSTTVSVKISNNVLLKNFSRNLYVAPLNEQVKTFSKSRLDKLFRYSVNNLIAKRYKSNQLVDQVFHKEFTNGAEVYMRNCFEEADNIRGLSIDDIFIDEVQDILVDALPVIMETQTRSQSPHLFLTGTPKTFSNTIQQKWEDSTQADWVIQCPHCMREQVMSAESVAPDHFICRNTKCGKPLHDLTRAYGRWEHRFPDRKMKGFRITQMMIPDIDPAKIYHKIKNYPTVRLFNEVLGRSYEQADKPITDAVMNQMLDYDAEMYEQTAGVYGPYANQITFLGIDWGEGEKNGKAGTGYTVMSVSVLEENGVLRDIYRKRFERGGDIIVEYQIETAMRLVGLFNVALVVADYGGGFAQNQTLRRQLGSKFFQCHYVGSLTDHYKYDDEQYKFLVHRTKWMTEFIDLCKRGKRRINARDTDTISWVKRNMKGIYSEYRISRSGRSEELFYGHPSGEPDDYMHASIYSWVASKIYSGELRSTVHTDSIAHDQNINLFDHDGEDYYY